MSATRPTFGALQFATSYAANLLLAHGDGASSDTIEWLHNNLRALLDAYDAAASSSSTPLSETPSEVRCSGCGIVAKQIAKPETLVGLQHYCGGTWRRLSLAPLSETPCRHCGHTGHIREVYDEDDVWACPECDCQYNPSLAPLSEPTSEGT